MPNLSRRQSERLAPLDTENLLNGYRGDTDSELYTPERHELFNHAVKALNIFPKRDSRDWGLRYIKMHQLARLNKAGFDLSNKERKFLNKWVPESDKALIDGRLSMSLGSFTEYFTHWHDMSSQVPEIAGFKYTEQTPREVVNTFVDYEKDWADRQSRMVKLDGSETILLEKDGLFLFNLNRSGCREEGAAMGHCGNGLGRSDQLVLSVRSKVEGAEEGTYRPHATIILEGVEIEDGKIVRATIGETKGYGNSTISNKYTGIIAEFIASNPAIIKKVRGGYAPEIDLVATDFTRAEVEQIVEGNPGYFDPFELYYVLQDRDHPLFKKSVEGWQARERLHEDNSDEYADFGGTVLNPTLNKTLTSMLSSHLDLGYYLNVEQFEDLDKFLHTPENQSYGTYDDLLRNSKCYGINNKIGLLHMALSQGKEQFTQNSRVATALKASLAAQQDALGIAWADFADAINPHLKDSQLRVEDGEVFVDRDLVPRFADLAEKNLQAIQSSNDPRRFARIQNYNAERSCVHLFSELDRGIKGIMKTADNVITRLPNSVDGQRLIKAVKGFRDARVEIRQHEMRVGEAMRNEVDAVEQKARQTPKGLLPLDGVNVIDSEAGISFIRYDSPEVLSSVVRNSDRNEQALRGLHNAIKGDGQGVRGLMVIGKVTSEGVEPYSMIPTGVKCEDRQTTSRAERSVDLEFRKNLSGEDMLNVSRLVTRNWQQSILLRGGKIDWYDGFLDAFSLAQYPSTALGFRPDTEMTPFDLCVTIELARSYSRERAASCPVYGELETYKFDSRALGQATKDIHKRSLSSVVEIGADSLATALSGGDFDGRMASNLLPPDHAERERLIRDGLAAWVEDNVVAQDKAIDRHWLTQLWGKSQRGIKPDETTKLATVINEGVAEHISEQYRSPDVDVSAIRQQVLEKVARLVLDEHENTPELTQIAEPEVLEAPKRAVGSTLKL